MDAKTVQQQFLRIPINHAIASGVWPYQTGIAKYISRISFILVGAAAVIPQINHVITFYSVDVFVFQCPFLAVGIGSLIKEITYMANQEKLKTLFDHVFNDWAESRSEEEYSILKLYYKRASYFLNIYATNAVLSAALFMQVPITPMVLDLILPLNESRETQYIWPTYYTVGQDKYDSLIILNMIGDVLVIYVVYVMSDTTYVFLVQHACALLEISGQRFKDAVPESFAREEGNAARAANEAYQKIRYSIQEHQHAVNFVGDIQVVHEVCFLIAVGFAMVCFSVTLWKISVIEFGVDFIKLCTFLTIQLVHLILMTFPGQMLIDKNDEVHRATYDSLWYNISAKKQSLYILSLRKSQVLFISTAGNLAIMNLQTLLAIVKTGVSYCMILRSR